MFFIYKLSIGIYENVVAILLMSQVDAYFKKIRKLIHADINLLVHYL